MRPSKAENPSTTRLLLTSKGEKTVCADRDDRGGVLLTGRDEQQVELTRGMILRLAVIALIPTWILAAFTNEVAA